jgi:hypothetical protein
MFLIICYFPGFPFDSAQGGESFDLAQDRELVERPVEPRVSPTICGLARNDGSFQVSNSLWDGRIRAQKAL